MKLSSLGASFKGLTKSVKEFAAIKPQEPKISVGLDIGSSSIKLVALGARNLSGLRPLIAQHIEPFRESEEGSATRAIRAAISSIRSPIKSVNLSVSGQWVIMRVIEMPTLAETELKQALPFEAQRHLPFNVQDVVLDGAVLGPSDANKSWVLLVACKKDMVDSRISLIKQAGLEPGAVDVDSVAIANAFVTSANGNKLVHTYALLNVGAQWTNLTVLKGTVPYLVRDIPWGFEKMVRQLAEQLGKDASYIVQQLRPNSNPATEILEAMKVSCESLTTDLQLSFDFFENRFGTPPEQIIVCGGTSQCPGFMDALKSHLAQSLNPWTFGPNGLSRQMVVAYGLALHGLGE
jgi:type IV pilus assembly protein PilM